MSSHRPGTTVQLSKSQADLAAPEGSHLRTTAIVCALLGLAGLSIHEIMQMEEEKKGLAAEPS